MLSVLVRYFYQHFRVSSNCPYLAVNVILSNFLLELSKEKKDALAVHCARQWMGCQRAVKTLRAVISQILPIFSTPYLYLSKKTILDIGIVFWFV